MARPPTKAQAITDAIAAQIADGEIGEDSWLPAERDLAQRFEVDRSTVRRALSILADRGLVTIEPNTGARVRGGEPLRREHSDLTRQEGDWRGFHVSALRSGREPYTKTTVNEVPADSTLARWLAVPIGTVVLERARVQGVSGEDPVQTATTWIPPDVSERLPILRQVDTGPGGIYSRLTEIGLSIRFEETVTCRFPSPDEQAILRVEPGQPVLVTWRRGYDQADHIAEVTHRVIVGDRHELVYSYGPTK
jgi:GntR family transcriptional regulator